MPRIKTDTSDFNRNMNILQLGMGIFSRDVEAKSEMFFLCNCDVYLFVY